MFWLQLGTLIAINVVIFAMLLIPSPNPHQHSGGGEETYDVWQLIDDVEAQREAEYTGRHRLQQPPDADEEPRAA
ncbi:hypothetical protein MOQ72_35375 [Saccharopolyspora sp. K220]|uniref:hypothetical protein n=1 Tax=Saccharopolyspora soli TaxID=2926618 RepID=UPI001F56222F|nr:hypothetical protein [Saccharopolyspora soli]MCI2422720.1 hypothetical protein [Saccharopolyspora soli]